MDLEALRRSPSAVCTISEVAELMHVDRRTVGQAITTGTIPSIRLGRSVLIPREQLLALLTATSTPVA